MFSMLIVSMKIIFISISVMLFCLFYLNNFLERESSSSFECGFDPKSSSTFNYYYF